MSMPAEAPASSTSQQHPRKMTALERNKLEWETHKNEIEEIYMDQDKTLEETMLFFKENRGLDWSKRYWKIKFKEWKFEKNVPSKEMSFMAAKARKRELEDRKETVFYRNGGLVDASKVQNKKQKLNVDNMDAIMVPETPQHMSYETPKPSVSQEHESSSPNPEAQCSELETLAGELSLEDPLRNEDQPVTSTSRDNPDYAASLTTTFLNPTEVIDLTGDGEKSSGDHIAQTRIVPKEQDAKAAGERLMPELLSQDFALARQLRRDGQLSRAAQQYFKDIGHYIDEGDEQSGQMIVNLVAELLQCLENVEPSDVPALACDCLDLLRSLQPKFSRTSQPHRSVLSALERLLEAHPEIPQEINLRPVVLALDEQGINALLYEALGLLLTRMRNQFFVYLSLIEFRFRMCLLAFACNLRECLKRDPWVGGISALKTTTWTLWDMGRLGSRESTRWLMLSRWENIADRLYCFFNALSNDLESVSRGYLLVEPSITEIAETCSLNGWGHEAELLFTILRSPESSSIVSYFRRFKISITYCLHLEREKRYEKLLNGLSLLFEDLENFCCVLAFGKFGNDTSRKDDDILQEVELHVKYILDRVPGSLDQRKKSEMAHEITNLICLLKIVRRRMVFKRVYNGDYVVVQEDRVEAEDDDDQMDDCTSSVRFGVTYTESVITGISFNYSDLCK